MILLSHSTQKAKGGKIKKTTTQATVSCFSLCIYEKISLGGFAEATHSLLFILLSIKKRYKNT